MDQSRHPLERRGLRNRIRLALAVMLVPLLLAGAGETLALTHVVGAFEDVSNEQRRELLPMGSLEAKARSYENAAYDAYYTGTSQEVDQVGRELRRDLAGALSAMDEAAERRQLARMQSALAAASDELAERLAQPFPARAQLVIGDPLARFAELVADAVAALQETQRVTIAENAVEVRAAQALRDKLVFAVALLVLLTIAAAIFLARGLSRRVLVPLEGLRTASVRIGAGDLDHRVAVDRPDELGAVGAAFNTMTEEMQAAQRDVRLAQDRLHQSQKLEAVGQLAGGVAHDFNNLLLVVQGYTSLVADSLGADDERAADLAIAQGATERAAKLTRQLLAFSRRDVAHPVVVDVNESLAQVEEMLQRVIPASIAVDFALDETAGTTTIDPGQLEQVIVNLVVNARDAIEGCGRIVISSGRVDADETFAQQHPDLDPGEYVTITVRDDGAGMTKEIVARIFEPFFTTKPRESGTGLGLAVLHGIVREAGGAVTVYSEPGSGSVFTVYLPSATAAAASAPASEIVAAPTLPGATVLVAEDEPMIRNLIERVLTDAGATAVVAGSAEEALLRARELDGDFDLLVSDLVMPGRGGSELADELARTYGRSRVIFISGYSADATHVDAEAAFLQKPFSRDTLLRAVADRLAA